MQRDLSLKLRALIERPHALLGTYEWSEMLGASLGCGKPASGM